MVVVRNSLKVERKFKKEEDRKDVELSKIPKSRVAKKSNIWLTLFLVKFSSEKENVENYMRLLFLYRAVSVILSVPLIPK